MSAYTPGPWRVGEREAGTILNERGTVIYRGLPQFSDADARLIAAAPELLEALKWAATVIRPGSDLRAAMDAAITKAEGRQP
jgi:hypothetical protein